MSRETQLNNAAIHNDEIKKIAELYRIIINTKEIGFVADFLFKRTQESEKNLLACSMLADEGVPIALYVCAALKVIKDPKEAASQISSGKGSKQALRICRALAESDIVIAQYLLGHVKCLETKGGQIWFDKVIENFRKEQEKFNQNKKTLNLAEARQEVNKTFVTLGWLAIFMVGREIIETQQKSDDKVRRHIKVVEQFKKWHESSNIENLYDSEVASYLLGLKAANYISTLEEVIIDSAKERKKRKWSIVESRKKGEEAVEEVMALLPYIDKEKEADLKTQERAINSIMEFYQSMLVIRLGGKYREAPLGELLYVSDLENDKNREVNQCIKNIKIFSNQYDSSYANRDLAYFYLLKGKSELAENHIRKVIPMEFIELLEEKNYNSLFLREDNNQEALRAQEKSLDIVILAFRVLLEGKIIECARKLGALTENQSASIELWLSCVTPFLEFLEEQSKIAKGWEGNLKSSVKNYQTNLNSVLKKASNMARFSKSAFGIIKYMAQLEKEASQNQDLILEKEELKSLKFLSKCSKLTKNLEHLLLRSENKEKLELNVLPPSQTPVNSKEKSVLLQEETTKEIAARIEKINKEAQEKKKKHKAALQPRLTLKQDEQSFEGEEKEENEINLEQGGRKNYLHIDLSKLNKVLKDAKIDDDEIIGYLKQAEDYNTNNKTYAGSAGHRGVKHLFKMKLEDEHCSVYRLRGNNNEERVLLIKKGEELLPLCADKYFHKRKNGEIMKEVRQAATQLGLCFNKEQNNKVNKPTTSPYPYFQELVSSTTTTMQLM